jgi:hypothetical protein
MLAATAALLQAVAPISAFAPPIEAPLLITTEHHSTIGETERRYRLERLLRFHRAAGGYRAEVRVLRPSSDASPAVGGMVEAGFAALADRTLVFHLDSAGKVTGIEDMAALWERLCQGIGAMVADSGSPDPAARKMLAQRIVTPLRALPDERRRAMLSTLVTAVIVDEAPDPVGALTPVHLPGASPLGQRLVLEGMRTTTAIGSNEIQSVTRASSGALESGGQVDLERTRRSDPRTGLLSFSSDTTRTVVGSAPDARKSVRTTVVRLVPARAETWGNP